MENRLTTVVAELGKGKEQFAEMLFYTDFWLFCINLPMQALMKFTLRSVWELVSQCNWV